MEGGDCFEGSDRWGVNDFRMLRRERCSTWVRIVSTFITVRGGVLMMGQLESISTVYRWVFHILDRGYEQSM